MKKSPVVSIVVPIFNVADYLVSCLNSLVNQTYNNVEIILVDDGSTDESGSICDRYKEKDNRIIVIHKPNGGLVSARKAGMEHATGEYLLHVDGDDWIEPDTVEVLVKKMLSNSPDYVQCGFCSGGRISLFSDVCIDLDHDGRVHLIERVISIDTPYEGSIWGKLFRKNQCAEIYNKIEDSNEIGEDLLFFIHLLSGTQKISYTDRVLFHYTDREESLAHEIRNVEAMFRYNILDEKIYYLIRELYPDYNPDRLNRLILYRQYLWIKLLSRKSIPEIFEYYLPMGFESRFAGCKLIIYGAGKVGRNFVSQLSKNENIEMVAWIDKKYDGKASGERIIEPVEKIRSYTEISDYVVIAVLDRRLAEEIGNSLIETYGIPKEKIVCDLEIRTIRDLLIE